MEKTRSFIGKALMAILILFALSVPFMSSASALYNPATNSLPTSTVFLTPSRINGTTKGETVTVYANATNYVDMDTIQIGLTWSNTTVAQCTSVALGNCFNSYPSDDIINVPGTINNTEGVITFYAWSLISTYNVNGSGTIAVFTFTISNPGYADVHLQSTFLENVPGYIIPITTIDYFTVVRNSQQYIVEIQGNPSQSSAVAPDSEGFYGESVTQMSPTKVDGVSDLTGNMTFAINGSSMDNGPFCYFNVTIPNNLMNCSGNNDDWVVALNGTTQGTRTVSQGTKTATISLAGDFYSSGVYATTTINIYSTSIAIPEFASTFSSVLLAILLTLATLSAALFIKTRPRLKRKE